VINLQRDEAERVLGWFDKNLGFILTGVPVLDVLADTKVSTSRCGFSVTHGDGRSRFLILLPPSEPRVPL